MLSYLNQFLSTRLRISTGVVLLAMIVIVALFFNRRDSYSSQERLNWLTMRLKELMMQYEELTDITFAGRDQEDPALVAYIRDHEMYQPSSLPYNLSRPDATHYSQYHQSEYADKNFLHGMTGGFFLEAGALDGEDKSNSLYFEKYKGWEGLLVEPNPSNFRHLVTLNRKAYAIHAGFSLKNISDIANFKGKRGTGKITDKSKYTIEIRTYPLHSMLLALGVSQVDFFSFDIEGGEKSVLDTIPWDKVRFRLICMEVNKFKGGRDVYVKYFEDRGYTFLGKQAIDAWFGLKELLQQTMDVDDWLIQNKNKIE